ncbi:MAG: TrbG/VirB9 family P-type conjugative transfer protein [Erythrobacter sp.]|nr:TrbG/VirB9 family P-type conjugative transfer protein [Erythrobacter sp.]
MKSAALLLPFASLALMSAPALAQEAQLSSETTEASDDELGDARIQTRVYDEAKVFTIRGKVKVQTTVKFAEDEAIQNVAIGDSSAWQVQPNKAQSLLFVKPLAPKAVTNLTVVTSKRTYLFDLIAAPDNAPLYVLQFRHLDLEKAKEEARLAAIEAAEQEKASELELAAANDPYAVADPAMLNFEWAGAGQKELLPARSYDNGEALFLTWPAGTAIPAILMMNEEGEEGPLNFTVRGDTVVIAEAPDQIVLRSGGETATLTNTGPTIIGPRQAVRR